MWSDRACFCFGHSFPKDWKTMAEESFELFLKRQDLAENTIVSYLWTIKHFLANYGEINRENLLAYKGFLLEHFKPQTVNLRLQGINKYLEFIRKEKLKMKFVKVQQKNYLENVISDADYRFLKRRLKSDGHLEWFFVVWFMGATVARISELLKVKAEHVESGYMDLYSKGGKIRRLYIPKMLREEAGAWLRETGISSGYIFKNRYGGVISPRGISQQLKKSALQYGLDPKVVYPHSFRHRFAKNFLDKYNDIAFLADLMGHESIETTRIYLRKTATEQQLIVDKIVTW